MLCVLRMRSEAPALPIIILRKKLGTLGCPQPGWSDPLFSIGRPIYISTQRTRQRAGYLGLTMAKNSAIVNIHRQGNLFFFPEKNNHGVLAQPIP